MQNNVRKIFFLFIISLIFFTTSSLFASPVYATNIAITCNQIGPCIMTPLPNDNLFFETNILPGHNVTRTLTITNTNETDDCSAYINTKNENDPNNLASRLWTVLKNDTTDIYGVSNGLGHATNNKNLTDIFGAGDISLGTVPVGSSKIFTWTVTFDPNAGNEYQARKTVYDFDAIISCGSEPTPTSTPLPNPTPGGGGGTTTTTTTATSPFLPITQFVTLLPRFFIPAGPTVAGAETEVTPTPEPEEGKIKGQVAGATACQTCIWWPLLVLQALATIFSYLYSRNKSKKAFLTGGFVISIFTYAIFLFLNRGCRNGWGLWLSTTSLWCKYFIIWVLLIFGILSFILRPKEKELYEVTPKKPGTDK